MCLNFIQFIDLTYNMRLVKQLNSNITYFHRSLEANLGIDDTNCLLFGIQLETTRYAYYRTS